jgi:uncharacterized protein YndB with AHSA1/START domain
MISYSSAVTIARPPADVFSYLVDPKKQALWSDVPMRQLTDGPISKGSRMEVSFGSGLMKAKIGLEITDLVEGERMAFDSFSGPINWKGAYNLRPANGGTELSQEGTLTFTGLWRAMEGMAGREISSGEIKELEKLKAVVESRS